MSTRAITIAEQWVDEMAALRIIKQIYGTTGPEVARGIGIDGTAISDRFGNIVTATWDYEPESPYISWRQFTDGSQAILWRDSERWDVFRG